MTPLPKQFRRDKFDFRQVMALDPIFIYEKTKGGWSGLEVIIARKRVGRILKFYTISDGWDYPSSEQWGQYGWTVQTMERARQKAFELADSLAAKELKA